MNDNGEHGHSCLSVDLRESSIFHFSMILVVHLSHIVFIILRNVPYISYLLRVFIRKGYWIYQMHSPHLLRWPYGFCSSFCWYDLWHLLIFEYWTDTCNSRSWSTNFLMWFWIQFSNIFWEYFTPLLIKDKSVVSFHIVFLFDFDIRVMLAS